MAYWLLQNDHATYAVDWDVVHRIVRDHHRAVARDTHSRVVTASDTKWYNPFSWSLPEIQSLEVDWDVVSSRSAAMADEDFARLSERATRDVRDVHRELQWMLRDTAQRSRAFTDQLAALQTENMNRINGAVDSYDTQIEVAKFFRDTSADGLMIGASVATGGAAGAVMLGGGSAMKGWAKYQDTGNAGAAVLTGVGNMTFGVFKLGGAKLKGSEEAVLTILQAQWETGVALVEGKSLGKAAATGSLKLAGPFVDRFFKLPVVTKLLEKACVPIAVSIGGTKAAVHDLAAKTLAKIATKQGVERYGKKGIELLANGAAAPEPERGSGVLQTATLGDDALLTLAIVNMSRGIGNGL